MRIISASFVLLIAIVIIFSNVAVAAEGEESNETKTNLAIFSQSNILLAYDDNKFEGFKKEKEPQKTEEELKREKALERYAEKRKKAVYPKGKFTINAILS